MLEARETGRNFDAARTAAEKVDIMAKRTSIWGLFWDQEDLESFKTVVEGSYSPKFGKGE